MALSTRFALDTTTVVAGSFLVVSAMAFSAPVAGWIGFGVSTLLLLAALASAITTHKNSVRIGHSALAVVALWSLIAALVFSGPVLTWLVFADGIALVVVALADLIAHESLTERVVHTLEVRSMDTTPAGTMAG